MKVFIKREHAVKYCKLYLGKSATFRPKEIDTNHTMGHNPLSPPTSLLSLPLPVKVFPLFTAACGSILHLPVLLLDLIQAFLFFFLILKKNNYLKI